MPNAPRAQRRPLISAGIALGAGLGGFLDGIVLHQLLQVHNMLSAKFPTRGLPPEQLVVNLEINMFWDGLFHAFTWFMTALGLILLWHAVRRVDAHLCTRTLLGSMLFGWGLFNMAEGILGHHVLELHHVIETPQHLPWDLAFLASGLAFMLAGWGAIRAGASDTTPDEAHTRVNDGR
jgi:uncharacterized membrane protein